MKDNPHFNGDDKIDYRCGKLSEMVADVIRNFLNKINEIGLKQSIENLLPGLNANEFVLGKIKFQMSKRRGVELGRGLGRADIQYRRGGIQIELSGFVRYFIKKITITDKQIIKSFDMMINQIEEKYIKDQTYIIKNIDHVLLELSGTQLYSPKTSHEKTFYDLVMLIIANHYQTSAEMPKWIEPALKNLSRGEFVERWLDLLAESVSEMIAQISKNIFFDFKITLDSFWLRVFLNKKTNKGQLSNLIDLMGIDIKKIVYDFAKKYVSPSFMRGAGDILCDIASGFLSNVESENEKLDFWGRLNLPDGAFDVTMSVSSGSIYTRGFRWFSKISLQANTLEYSYDSNFEKSVIVNAVSEVVNRTFPKLNLGLVANYCPLALNKYSVCVRGLHAGTVYYRILYKNGGKSEVFSFNIKDSVDKCEFLVFADSQGMVKHDYDVFVNVFEKALEMHPGNDFLVHLGDFVDDGNNEEYWKWVLDSKEWAQNATLPVAGNHEVRMNAVATKAGVENSVLAHFNVCDYPKQDVSNGVYYSFEQANILFVVLCTNNGAEHGIDDEQYRWAIKIAKESDCTWKILLTHKSPYSNGPHHKDADVKIVGEKINDIAYYGKFDLVIGGHDHVYARTPALVQGRRTGNKKMTAFQSNCYTDVLNSPTGSVFVVPGTSGVKNYKQNPVVKFPHDKFLDLKKPVYSHVSINTDELCFDAYAFDEKNQAFEKIDSFKIKKHIPRYKSPNSKIFELIKSIPDMPWKDNRNEVIDAMTAYAKLDYNDKIKIKYYDDILKLYLTSQSYHELENAEICHVCTKKEFLTALSDKTIGTIVADCNEIKFDKTVVIDHDVKILGSAKLCRVTFDLQNHAFVMIGEHICIDNTVKPCSIWPAMDCVRLGADCTAVLTDNATICSGYGWGKNGYGFNCIGENNAVYLNSSGHNYVKKGVIFAPKSSSKISINSGKYFSDDSSMTILSNGVVDIYGGFVKSLKLLAQANASIYGGTIGDENDRTKILPLDCAGKLALICATINSHKGVSVQMHLGGKIFVQNQTDGEVDIKGEILYNK